jgi:hypothetical protein
MVFKPGDIIGNNALIDRIVLTVDRDKQQYGIGFVSDPKKTSYCWQFDQAHITYAIIPPTYIPEEQYENYRKMRDNG